jgi:hypothetical protein
LNVKGLLDGDTVKLIGGSMSGVYASADAGTDIAVTVTPAGYSSDNTNYQLPPRGTSFTLTGDINKRTFTGGVTITGMSGAPKVGDALTANVTETGEAGSFTYLWDGAGNPTDRQTYTVTAADLGKTLTVTIGTANPNYSGTFVSAATEAVQEPPRPVFTVTFDPAGGTVSPVTLTTGENGRLAYLPTPVRGGFRFTGWFSMASGGVMISANTVFNDDTTVFAHWTLLYPIYIADGNDDRSGEETDYNPPATIIRTNPTVSPASLTYDREDGGDLIITLTGGGYVLKNIVNEGYTLDRGDDYTVSSSKITVKESYLNTLAIGKHTLTFMMSNNIELAAAVTITGEDETAEEPTPIPTQEPEPQPEPIPTPEPTATPTPTPIETSQPEPAPLPPVPYINPFSDVQSGDWFIDYVTYVYQHGLMTGISTEPMMFGPNVPVSRGMMITVLWRMAGSPGGRIPAAAGGGQFTDVPEDAYYYQAVNWAAANGIVSGIGDGLYAPDTPISRQDLAVILGNYAELSGKTLPEQREYSVFTDDADIADYAREAIAKFYRAMIINGKGENAFDPKGEATRAEVAAVLTRFIEE